MILFLLFAYILGGLVGFFTAALLHTAGSSGRDDAPPPSLEECARRREIEERKEDDIFIARLLKGQLTHVGDGNYE